MSYTYCIVEIGYLGSVQDILVHLPLWKLGLVCASALTISVMDGARCDALPDGGTTAFLMGRFFDEKFSILCDSSVGCVWRGMRRDDGELL